MSASTIDQKLHSVSKDICDTYSEKITEALFHNHNVTKEKKRFQEIDNVLIPEQSPTSQTPVEKVEESTGSEQETKNITVQEEEATPDAPQQMLMFNQARQRRKKSTKKRKKKSPMS